MRTTQEETVIAAAMKDFVDAALVERIAAATTAAWPAFRSRAFVRHVLDGLEALELMDRLQRVADALRRFDLHRAPRAEAIP